MVLIYSCAFFDKNLIHSFTEVKYIKILSSCEQAVYFSCGYELSS